MIAPASSLFSVKCDRSDLFPALPEKAIVLTYDASYYILKGELTDMKNIIISACLIGCNTRYNGGSTEIPELDALKEKYHLIPVCPEQLGGLATPRDPAEQRSGAVITSKGADVTSAFAKGAEEVLRLAQTFDCNTAILKERSPSCGYGRIYDGTFSGTLTDGNGITAELLASHGIRVVGESHVAELLS